MMPNAPRNLLAYPFRSEDKLLIKNVPNLFISGNSEKFLQQTIHTRNFGSIKLISLPRFAVSSSLFLLNLNDYAVYEWKFGDSK
jgi:DNA polymerase II small subunit/DNA polymerase delta subunit B